MTREIAVSRVPDTDLAEVAGPGPSSQKAETVTL